MPAACVRHRVRSTAPKRCQCHDARTHDTRGCDGMAVRSMQGPLVGMVCGESLRKLRYFRRPEDSTDDRARMRRHSRIAGFTLIEVMITVAVVAILGASRASELHRLRDAKQARRGEDQPVGHAHAARAVFSRQPRLSRRLHRVRGGRGPGRQDLPAGEHQVLHRHVHDPDADDLHRHRHRHGRGHRVRVHDRPGEHPQDDQAPSGLEDVRHVLGHPGRTETADDARRHQDAGASR